MSLLIKSGDRHFEVCEAELAACEIPAPEFEAGNVRSLAGDGGMRAFQPFAPSWNATDCAQVCDTYSGYGASCSKAPNCP
jgi:hypothetical protein